LASRVLNEFKQKISNLTLVPSGGGCFELTANGELLYSKLKTGQFPDEQSIVDTLGKRLAKK
jgi:selenoprotein W-related protein